MKKLLAFVLILALCLSLCTGLTACVQKETGSSTTSTQSGLDAALMYVKTLYKETTEKTSRDFTRIGSVPVNGKTYEVVWSVDVAEEFVKVVKNADGTVTIDVNETSPEEVHYTLTATIKDGDKVVSYSWKHIVPKVNLDFGAIVDEAYALEQGASMDYEVTLTGVINKVDTPYDDGYKNVTVTMDVVGIEGKPIQCYRLKGEGAENLKPGDTITVSGILTNYQGKIQFQAGCVLLSVTSAGEVEAPTDVATIMKEAFELPEGGSTQYQATLTGKITKINTPYNPSFKNVSVTIEIEGYEGKELLCYRVKGEGADSLLIGDTITVKGYIVNYKGGVQFGEGSSLLKVEKTGSEVEAPSDVKQILKDAYALKENESTPYRATLTGVISSMDDYYNPQFSNVTVTIIVGGDSSKPIKCYRIKGEGADKIGTGDTITVTGFLTNYKGSVQFAEGSALDKWENTNTAEEVFETLTVKEAIDMGAAMEHNTTTKKKYKVTGVITEVKTTDYGNMYITDGKGNSLYLYGTYSKDGTLRYDAMPVKPDAGDTITVLGVVGNFYGAQMKNVWIQEHTPGEFTVPSYEELGLPATDGAEITLDQANKAGEKIPHNMYTENKYKVTGEIIEIKNTTYGNLSIKDADGKVLYIHGTFNADGSVRYDALDVKPIVGDTITVLGIVGNYNGTAQMKNGNIIDHKVPETQLEVSFNLNYDGAGEAPASVKVNPNTAYGTLPTPIRDGYKFISWHKDAECTSEAVTPETAVTESHVLYAKWEKVEAIDPDKLAEMQAIVDAAYALTGSETLTEKTLIGQIVEITTAYNENNSKITVILAVEGREDKAIKCYNMTGDNAADVAALAIGDTITVTGTLKVYKGTVQFDPATLVDVVKGTMDVVTGMTDAEIVDAAYAVEKDRYLPGRYTLTGKITSVDKAYDPTYGNVEVTIVVEGKEDKPIKVYRVKGEGAGEIAVGDTITVTGIIKNYNGTVEFDQGCILVSYKKPDSQVKVSFDVNGAGIAAPDTIPVNKNGVYGTLPTVEWEGHTFGGWYKDAACTGEAVTATTPVTEDHTLYAKWTENAVSTDPVAVKPEVGKAYKLYIHQKNRGEYLYMTGEMSGYYYATTLNADEAVDVYVEEVSGGYRVYFMKGETKTYLEMAKSGTHNNVIFVTNPTKTLKWNEEIMSFTCDLADGDYYWGTFNTFNTFSASAVSRVTGDGAGTLDTTNFVAHFTAAGEGEEGGETPDPTPVVFDITFDLNGAEGTAPTAIQVEKDKAYGILPTAERDGYTFGGWFKTPECDGEAVTADTTVTEEHTLYAKWIEKTDAPVVAGGSADFNTIVTSNPNGDSSYTKTFTTANGWTVENSAIQTGGATVMNPQYPVIGLNNTFKAVCLNGKTSAFGKLTSPTLTTGISKLTINYTKMFTDTDLSVTVTVKDAAGNTYTHVIEKRGIDKNEKYVVYTDEWTLDTPVVGEFTIEVVNNCPSNSTSNKDRMTILSLVWEGAASHTHEYTSTTTATCTEAGVTTYTCECGDTYTEETEKLGHIDENLDIECDREGCTAKVAPPADSLLSNFTANCLGSKLSVDRAYYVEGVIVEVLDQKNGIFLIDDGTGEKFYFRLPKNAEGVSHANWEIKLTTGDKVSVYGKINKYNASSAPNGQFWPAMQGPVATLLEQHAHDFTAVPATCSKPAYCACGQSHGEPLGCADTNGDSLCDDCGKNVNYIFEYVEIRTDNGSGVHDATANTYTWSGENFGVQVAKASGGNLYTTSKDHMRLYKGNTLVLSSENGKAVKMIVVYLTNATQIANFEKFLTGYTYTKNEEAFTVTVEVDFADQLILTNPSSNGSTTQIKGVDFGYEKPGVTPDPVVYDVTFNLNYEGAENNIEKITVEEGAAYGTLPTAAREGYTFGGWYLTAECDGDAVTANTTVSASHTLYAKWTRNVARVFFSLNYTGAAGAPDFITVNVGEAYGTLPADPTREGYTFGGWYTDAACTGEAVKATDTVSADHTLYAKWTANAPVVVAGGSADFSTLDAPNGDQNYAAHTTTNGWKTTNSAILVGGTTDSNPVFKVVGPDKTHKAVCMNGKTSAVGKITSPMLTTGISKLTVKYTMPFSDTKLSVKVTIKDANGQTYATHDIVHNGATKLQAYEHEWVLEAPLVGNFTIEVVNNCPSASTKNKDRFAIISLAWEGAASGGVTPEPTPDTTPGATPEPTPDDTDAPVAPQTPAEIVDAAYGLASGATLDGTYTLTGKVTSVKEAYNASFGNVSVWMTVEGKEDKPILCYRMTGTGADEVAAGYTITVTGSLTNYNGTIEFAKGCTLDSYVEGSLGTENMTPSEIVDAAYALETNKTMAGNYTLTGVITSIDNAYSTEFNNITVTMVVEGKEDKPIKCYRMKGSGADVIAIGDTITVSGILKNYDGTVEFDTGCTLDSYEKDGSVVVPPATGDHVEPENVVYAKGSPSSSNYTNVVKNWGIRGDVATSLSPMATAFYTGTNTYVELAKLSGSSTLSSVPQSNLYTALKTLMVNKHSTITSYDDVRYLFAFTDCERADSTTLSLFYCGENVSSTWNGNTMNREHCWPKSHTSGSTGTTTVDADIMTLRPTKPSNNSDRGNDPYGTASGSFFPNTFTTTYDLRGDCARIVLYTYVRWGETNLTSVIDSVDLLLSWNQIDPVDSWELARNDSVQSITGTRNVFVDYPELAFILFGREVPAGLITPSAA